MVKSAEVDYVSPARMDDLLQVTVSIDKMARTYIGFKQVVMRNESVLCEAMIKVACVDQRTMRPTQIPKALQTAFAEKNSPG